MIQVLGNMVFLLKSYTMVLIQEIYQNWAYPIRFCEQNKQNKQIVFNKINFLIIYVNDLNRV